MNTKSKNLILIVGNGFDLAHKFKTSYNDFANYIIEKKLSPKLITTDEKDTLIKKEFLIELRKNIYLNPRGNFIEKISHHRNNTDFSGISETLKSHKNDIRNIINNAFLGKLFYNHYENWFDIENAYFHELISIDEQIVTTKPKKEQIISLNKDLIEIKAILFEYLKSVNTESNRFVNAFFKSTYFKSLEKIYVINFNYTITIENYIESDNRAIINYIHGDIESKDIIFGYGNDQHPKYKELKESGINEYLRFFKTFEYLNNNKYLEIYEQALEFFEDYDVAILGHSLGQTDKTLLKEILNNPKCRKINLYKRSDLSDDKIKLKEEFNKLIFSISRIIDNEKDLRVKVLNFEGSSFFP